jgi:hypothetical protein
MPARMGDKDMEIAAFVMIASVVFGVMQQFDTARF